MCPTCDCEPIPVSEGAYALALRILAENLRKAERIVHGDDGVLAVFEPETIYNAATGEEYTYDDFLLDRQKDSIT